MTDKTTDQTVEQLKERIAELEQHVYPSRRDVMAAAVGAVGYGALTGTASAAPSYGSSSGSVGTSAEPLTDVFAQTARVQDMTVDNALSAESLVIGGTLYEEDANSPLSASNTSSTTYSVGGTYDHIIIIPQHDNAGYNQMRVNGDAGSNYEYIDNGDAETTGATEWAIPRQATSPWIDIFDDRKQQIRWSSSLGASATGQSIAGQNGNVSGPISQVTFLDSDGSPRSLKARVFGRVMSI